MRNENGAANQNGRVTTRDLLAAVEGSEQRITHRLDRFEESVTRKFSDHDQRLAVLETEQAIDSARTRGIVTAIAGIKGFILVAVAIVSMAVGLLGASYAIQDHSTRPNVDVTIERPQT